MNFNMKKHIQLMNIICFIMSAHCVYSSTTYTYLYTSYDFNSTTLTISTAGNYAFYNDTPYSYTPIDMSSSSPAIKITASDVTVDFQNIGVTNTDTTHSGWIGIEVGWTPQELLDDPTRVQPKNVTLKNLSLKNFDCGIVIHQGVHLAKLRNITLYDVSVGVAMLGLPDALVHNSQISNVTIFGHGQNYHDALVNLKTIIETNYGYGSDYFMPLQADPLNSGSIDVYTYFGIWANYIDDTHFNTISINGVGYADFATVSEGNGNRTQAIGLFLNNSKRIEMHSLSCVETSSELKSVGMQLDTVVELDVDTGEFSYSSSNQVTVGIEVTNKASATYSCSTITLNNTRIKDNISGLQTIGLNISNVQGFFANNLESKLNKGAQQAYGLYTSRLNTAVLHDCNFNQNQATQLTNTVATQQGIMAVGFYGTNVSALRLYNSESGGMTALNSAYGLYLFNATSCLFETCNFVANTASTLRSGEAADIRSQQDSQEISKHAPVVAATSTGAYGIFCDSCISVKFDTCLANTNVGHRATGMRFQNCRAVVVIDSYASAQQASGFMFDTSLLTDNAANPHAIAIQPANKALLFGNFTKTTVDALVTTDLFLQKMTAIRTAQAAGDQPAYDDLVGMVATYSLLHAAVARYRLWGTAIGIHCHNVQGFLMQNSFCSGQVSALDSGMGVCCTGRNIDVTLESCQCLFNIGDFASVVTAVAPPATYAYSYNLIGSKVFWSMLTSTLTNPFPIAPDANSVGIVSNATTFKAQGNKTFGDGTSGDDIWVNLNGTDHRVIVSPVGPTGAGVVLGDSTMEGIVRNCSIYGSLGNSGHGFGVLLDNTFSVTMQSNFITGNISNIYGLTAGILDLTAHSPNLFMNNFLEGNKCSTYNNANYLIPFNPADPNGLAFPATVMMNGKFTEVNTDNDNIVMQYSQAPEFYSIEFLASIPQHPDLLAYLTANSCWA